MASPHNIELEAAKFLHKLIQDSKDEPSKLATKLYVILQHMKSSGKEHSMPYQVISRAMETVINQHGLDIEALRSSRLPLTSGAQMGDSSSTQYAGSSSQVVGVAKDSKAGVSENEMSKIDPFSSSRPPVGPSGAGLDYYQVSGTQRSSQSFDHESPSSLDTRSANSQSQERQKEVKKATTKRKRGDSSTPVDAQNENPQQLDIRNPGGNLRKGKMNKVESPGSFSVKGGEHSNFGMVPSSGQMDHFSSLPGNMSSVLRAKLEGQNVTEKPQDSTNLNNSFSRAPNPKFPDEVEVSSSHNSSGLQQGNSVPSTNDLLASRGVWNQNRLGFPFERTQVPRFPPNAVPGNMTTENSMQHPTVSSIGASAFGKIHGGMPIGPSSYPAGESGSAMLSPGESQLEPDGGSSNTLADANRMVQVGRQNSISGATMLRTAASRDVGKSSLPQAPAFSGMPFKEQQLKQLRAQCLVFLAFRNGLMPKKLHLEIALGNMFSKEDGPRKELADHHTVKAQSSNDPNSIPGGAMQFGRLSNAKEPDRNPPGASSSGKTLESDSLSREAENSKTMEDKSGAPPAEERKQLITTKKSEAEMKGQEIAEAQAFLTNVPQQPESLSTRGGSLTAVNPVDDMENGNILGGRSNLAPSVMGMNKQMNSETNSWTGIGNHNEFLRRPLPASTIQHELAPKRKDNVLNHFQNVGNNGFSGNQHADGHLSSFSMRERWKPVSGTDNGHQTVDSVKDASMMSKQLSLAEQDEEDKSMHTDMSPSPKYTMSEKWIMDMQKKKHLVEQSWILKQQKARQRISSCYDKLKENVSSSEDISAKTKSVIELKKLQLFGLQRRLRSDFLTDFFKPVATDMDRLRSYKKHRHGRRIKQLEKYEQKMKEERQKRIRERQKEFFSEIEVHKERLDDVFKIKRERWRGFNKYVKEFHKRKERNHRDKIDRIQREKINLLKINDVEGYLRMVQDAKSDRVKQLLKETEKYLQKLGSKLQQAKALSSRFEHDMDEIRTPSIIEKYEPAVENEDEAKHYLESNEKYYLMAHSIKESIAEQPTCLLGGKLREYQMNGLRWLVSLYNNHLNGILADEMGLGKTVQVIALICYLMETKNDRGPFLVVVPSSVLPGWESEINFWAPGILQIVYSGPPEERRRLFKEKIVHQKFNVLLTTYEYLMNKHDRPKLSKIQWHYVIIDEGHRIKNASCKLNAELKHYQSSHRLLLTGTPLQNNLEELWALLNFLLPNIFNSSEDFSQWFNKPFESNSDNSADQALLSEEENLLIINRLHQVLRPFVLRRLKHKVENQLPEKIERLIRCEASAYQKLLMRRVEDNLGTIGNSKARSVHNSVMELRNICNHPYLSQLHAEEVDTFIPKHYLPPIIRLCGKLEMLDRLLPKLKATDHRVLFFSTMTRLLDVMEDYLTWKQYRYLRLDGHTSGGDRGALIEKFNHPDSPFFIFLLSIRAGGVGVNLQAADTVIIFDTDWNPQVDLQAQARAHRIGQKRDVLVLRFETVQTVEEQVRASAEHKLGVANQSITAGFFDNNTSAEDRREYLESLLRECKKEEAAPVLDDDALNDILARSESEIDVFESVDKQRREEEIEKWKSLVWRQGMDSSEPVPSLPSRLVTDDDLKTFYEAMKIYDVPKAEVPSNLVGVKRKSEYLGSLDTKHYGRGKRAREVRSYEEQWTEEEFEKMCQAESPDSPKSKDEGTEKNLPIVASGSIMAVDRKEPTPLTPLPLPPLPPPPPPPPPPSVDSPLLQQSKEVTPPSKRGRGRPRRADKSPVAMVIPAPSATGKLDAGLQKEAMTSQSTTSVSESLPGSTIGSGVALSTQPSAPSLSVTPASQSAPASMPMQTKGRGRKIQSGVQPPRRRGKKHDSAVPASSEVLPSAGPDLKTIEQPQSESMNPSGNQAIAAGGTGSSIPAVPVSDSMSDSVDGVTTSQPSDVGITLNSEPTTHFLSVLPTPQPSSPCPVVPLQSKGPGRKTQGSVVTPRRRGKRQASVSPMVSDVSADQHLRPNFQSENNSGDLSGSKADSMRSKKEEIVSEELTNAAEVQACSTTAPAGVAGPNQKSVQQSDVFQPQQPATISATHDSAGRSSGPALDQVQRANLHDVASGTKEVSDNCPPKGGVFPAAPESSKTVVEVIKSQSSDENTDTTASVGPVADPSPGSTTVEGMSKIMHHVAQATAPSSQPIPPYPSVPAASQSISSQAPGSIPVKRQGRKTQSRVEAPRRRGRKQGSGLHVISDGSAALDPKLIQQSQSRTISLRNKQETDAKEQNTIVQANASDALSPGGLVGHDSRQREPFANPRIQTDINDVARVIKEIFSGTCSSKAKTGDSSANDGKDAPMLAMSGNTITELSKKQSSEDTTCGVMPFFETAPPGFETPINKHKEQSETASDARVITDISPVSGEALTSNTEAFKPESMSVVGSADSLAESRPLPSENLTTKITCTAPSTASQKEDVPFEKAPASDSDPTRSNTGPSKTQVLAMVELPPTAENNLKRTPSSNNSPSHTDYPSVSASADDSGEQHRASLPVSRMVDTPYIIEFSSGNNSEPSSEVIKSSHHDIINAEVPSVPVRADTVGDYSEETSFPGDSKQSNVVGPSDIVGTVCENSSDFSAEKKSQEAPPSIRNTEGPEVSAKADVCDGSGNPVDSNAEEPPSMTDTNIQDTNFSMNESPKLSSHLAESECPEISIISDLGIHHQEMGVIQSSTDRSGSLNVDVEISDRSDIVLMEAKVAGCSTEAIIESQQVPQRASDTEASLELTVAAADNKNASSVDSPDKGNNGAPSCGIGDKVDLIVEPVCSLVDESANVELASGDQNEVQLPLIVEKRDDDVIEACSMEVEPSNTQASSPKEASTLNKDNVGSPSCGIGDKAYPIMEAGIGHQSEVSPNDEIVAEHMSENEGVKVVVSHDKDPVGSILVLHESRESEAENEGDKVAVSADNLDVALVASTVSPCDSKVTEIEVGEKVDFSVSNGINTQNSVEDLGTQSSPLATVEKAIEGSSREDPICSSVVVGDSKGSVVEVEIQMDVSRVGDIDTMPKTTSEDSNTLSLSLASEEKIEDLSQKDIVDSSMVVDDKMNVSHGGGIISKDLDQPPELMGVEEEKIEDSSIKDPIGSSVVLEDLKASVSEAVNRMDVSQVGGVMPESLSKELGVPSSSMATEEQQIEDSSEMVQVETSLAVEDSKGCLAEQSNQIEGLSHKDPLDSSMMVDDKMDSFCDGGIMSENLDRPSSLFGMEDKRIEDSSIKDPVGSSVVSEDLKASIAEAGKRMDVSQVGGVVPENLLEDSGFPSSLLSTQEEKGASEIDAVRTSAAREDSKCCTEEQGDQMEGLSQKDQVESSKDVSCGVGMVTDELDRPSPLLGMQEDKIEDSSIKERVGSSVVPEDSKASVAEPDSRMDVSQVGVFMPQNLSEELGPPSLSLVTEEQKIESSEMDPVKTLGAVEDSKSCIAERGDGMDVSHGDGVMLENLSEDLGLPSSSMMTKEGNSEGCSKEDSVSNLADLKECVVEADVKSDFSQQGVMPDNSDVPSFSLAMEEETREDFSEKDPVSNLVALVESKECADEADDKMDVSQVGVIPENMGLPSSTLVTEEETIEGCSEEDPISSLVPAEDSKECAVEADDKIVVSEDVALPENLDKPSSTLDMEEETKEGCSDKDPVSNLVAPEDSKEYAVEADDKMDIVALPENLGLPSSSTAMKEETIDGCCNKDPISSLVPPEASKESAVEADDKIVVSQDVALPENLGVPSSSSVIEEEAAEGCSEKDSKECVAEADDKIDQGGVMPENLGLQSSSSVTEEDNIEGCSEKEPVSCLVSLQEVKGSAAEAGNQMDASQGDGAV